VFEPGLAVLLQRLQVDQGYHRNLDAARPRASPRRNRPFAFFGGLH
jgi:hypothetical protein